MKAADVDLTGADKCSAKLGLSNRVRGWVFRPRQLGFDLGPEPDEVTTVGERGIPDGS